jgi:hypothetical protein
MKRHWRKDIYAASCPNVNRNLMQARNTSGEMAGYVRESTLVRHNPLDICGVITLTLARGRHRLFARNLPDQAGQFDQVDRA